MYTQNKPDERTRGVQHLASVHTRARSRGDTRSERDNGQWLGTGHQSFLTESISISFIFGALFFGGFNIQLERKFL